MKITSLKNKRIIKYAKLKQKKYRDQYRLFLVEGEHLVEEAKKRAIVVDTIALINSKFDADIYVSESVMKKISSNQSLNEIVAVCHFFENESANKKIIALDDVQDPGNVGSIIRTAYAFGYDSVLLSKHSVDKYNEKLIQASQGAFFHIHVQNCSNIETSIQSYKKKGYSIISTALSDESISLESKVSLENFLIIFGNEGQGVSEKLLKMSDYQVMIPMKNFESLNVSVAAGIIMYTYR